MLAVGEYEDGALDAAEEFLDDDFCRGVAKHAVEHLTQFHLGFLKCRDDEHALAGGQSVSLQYIGRL